MNKKNQIIYALGEIDSVVESLAQLMPYCSVFTFSGSLGAGKTTLIKHLLAYCGVADLITSPTFLYVIPYTNDKGQIFYHFDLYRLKTVDDFIDAGFAEYLYAPNSWAFIEWPEIIQPLLKQKFCNVFIDYYGQNERIVNFELF